jgi:putative toxin-antitoxin system toxin component, PIN family
VTPPSPPPRKPLVIFDTGIILQATLTPRGASERALQLLESGMVIAVMNNYLRAEYEDVLRRLASLEKYAQLRRGTIIVDQLARVDALVERVPNAPERIVYPRDPKDAPTVNLAIEVAADFIVTRDADLLDLNNNPTFQKVCPKTRIVDPVDFLEAVEEWEAGGATSEET